MLDETDRLIGRVGFDWKITPWLSLNWVLGNDFYAWNWSYHYAVHSSEYPYGQIYYDMYIRRDFNSDLMLVFNHQFNNDWRLGFRLGNNLYNYRVKYVSTQGNGLELPDFYNLSNSPDIIGYNNTYHYRSASLYGDMEIAFRNMVYLTFTGRNDWSTSLPADNNSFFYPSANLSWIFTELNSLGKSRALPFGKLRMSYAVTAMDPGLYNTSSYYVRAVINDTWAYGLRFPLFGYTGFLLSNFMGNEKLKPEKTTTWEIGTDLRFLDNRITLDFTYFNSYSEDLLISVPIAPTTGFTSMYMNAAEMSSKGYEITLGGQPVTTSNWSWNFTFNFTRIKNIVEKLAPDVDHVSLGGTVNSLGAREGLDYQSFFGYDWLRDENGNVIINDDPGSSSYGFPMGNYDTLVYLGNYNPDWRLGWSNEVRWKNLSFTFLFDFKIGGMLFNGTKGSLYSFGNHADQVDREPDDLYIFPGVKQSDGTPNDIEVVRDINWYNKGEGSTFSNLGGPFMEDAGWIRLREIALSYRFDSKILGNGFFKALELYVSGKNLWLHTDYTGIDPETSLYGSFNRQGFDYYNNPGSRQVTFGVRAEF
jgi:outer membrane receptor protein involved in Fe transport